VYLTNVKEATALGAAMAAKMALTGIGFAELAANLANDFGIDYEEVGKSDMPELFSYREAWLSHARPL
jgi:sugar (pentulose or hexulose) kinase